MDFIYNETHRIYKNFAKKLLQESIDFVNATKQDVTLPRKIVCLREKVIIPFIESCAKSNFLTLSHNNIYTKDDPILRYIPSNKSVQSSITWYEGAVFGMKSLDETNMIDFMFIKMCILKNKGLDAINYIKSTFGRDPSNLFNDKNTKAGELEPPRHIYNMHNLFCSMCCVFDCGIHELNDSKILNVFEPDTCFCSNYDMPPNDLLKIENIDLFYKLNGKMAPCLAKLIFNIQSEQKVCCRVFEKLKVGWKSYSLSKRKIDPLQFYEPCNHTGKCVKGQCECSTKNTYCEIYCSCSDCHNLFYCNCHECTSECPCRKAFRECGPLCKCDMEAMKCENKPIINKIERKSSICRSLMHGLGLYAEEFIPKDSFVFEYTGELISDKEAERRGNFYELNHLSYLFNCCNDGDNCLYSIDAFFIGNKSRFINHSISKSNLKSEIMISFGVVKIVFYSTVDIYKGEEFLFDYKFTDEHKLKHGIMD